MSDDGQLGSKPGSVGEERFTTDNDDAFEDCEDDYSSLKCHILFVIQSVFFPLVQPKCKIDKLWLLNLNTIPFTDLHGLRLWKTVV